MLALQGMGQQKCGPRHVKLLPCLGLQGTITCATDATCNTSCTCPPATHRCINNVCKVGMPHTASATYLTWACKGVHMCRMP